MGRHLLRGLDSVWRISSRDSTGPPLTAGDWKRKFGDHLRLNRKKPTLECHYWDGQIVDTTLYTLAKCLA